MMNSSEMQPQVLVSDQEFNIDISTAVIKAYGEEYTQGCNIKREKNKIIDSTTHVKNERSKRCIDDSTKPNLSGDVDENTGLAGMTCEDGLKILEALSVTGQSSVRYAKDIPGITKIVACNAFEENVLAIKANITANNVQHLITAVCDTAPMVMYKHRKHCDRFNVVDVNPTDDSTFKYLDTAVQCVGDGGLLLVTFKDDSIGCGLSFEECYRKYGSVVPAIPSWREMTLRVVLKCVESHANRHGRYVEPLLSVYTDNNVRLFMKIFIGPVVCKQTLSKLSMVLQCFGCHTFTLQPLGLAEKLGEQKNRYKFSLPRGPPVDDLCQHCSDGHNFAGPIWSGPLHNELFISRLEDMAKTEEFSTGERMKRVLAAIREERNLVCLYYTLDDLHLVVPTNPPIPMMELRTALLNAGHQVTCSHAQEGSIKTDASSRVVWDIIRCWAREHPSTEKLGKTAQTILATEPVLEANFNSATTNENI